MSSRFERGMQVLADRSVWEQRQRLYYTMRHDGMRRMNKPFPNAADSHFPLIDMHVGDMKPFWVAQAFGGDRLCDFVCMREQLMETTEAAADYFDFELRYRSDFRLQFERMVDTMLLRGRGILKATVDPFHNNRIVIRSVDPQFILMGANFDDFDDADSFVEVVKLTVPQYRRQRNYEQDEKLIARIIGNNEFTLNSQELDKQLREGVTHSSKNDEIVLWLDHERTESGWLINTYSPQAPDLTVRDPYQVPYQVDGETSLPFFSFTMEIKDAGWHSPRGLAELNAAFEVYATKLWNEKADAMTFSNRPLFTSPDKTLANAGNIRFMPGEFIPGNITAVQMPAPAMSFAEEMNFTRSLSEQRSRMPDFGITDSGGEGKPRTATENNRIASLQSVGADHNGDMFRAIRLLKFYRHVNGLIAQFQERKRSYYMANNLKELPAQAMHDQYLVLPAGGTANKQQRLQRAGMRFSMFKGAPNVDQDGLVRDVLAADDARLIPKLLIPSKQKAASEAEDEAVEIGIMMLGFPAQVMPGEDHATRIMVLVGFLEKAHVTGQPVDPIAKQRIQQHLQQHFAILKQTQPEAARQVAQQIQQMEAAAQAQPGGQMGQPPEQQPGPATAGPTPQAG